MNNTATVKKENIYMPGREDVERAATNLKGVIDTTPLLENINLSERYSAKVLLKREDLHQVRSYKIRGAYNKVFSLTKEEAEKGVVCASAGNHAQGVALSCKKLGIKGTIFMPVTTPSQKVQQVKMFGKDMVELILSGDTFDDTQKEADEYCHSKNASFIHPFDDEKVIEGQATIALELMEQTDEKIDYLFVPVGGGGLLAGVGSMFRLLSPETKIIGVEPEGAPSMKTSFENGYNTTLDEIEKFVDGAAVKRVGEKNFEIARRVADKIITVPEGEVCTTILKLYNEEALVVEPAGALSVTALNYYREAIKGKNAICVISGSNNDITRTEEIKERSMLHRGLKHYFIIRFPQRPGALKTFVNSVLGPKDNITLFEYHKKHNREKGPALVGIELVDAEDFDPLLTRLNENGFKYEYINNKPDLFQYLVL